MKELIRQTVADSIEAKKAFFSANEALIEACAKAMADTLDAGGKLLLFGNGGSAADCQHIAAEFINRFQMERRPLAAIALTCDTSILTSIGNDYSFDEIEKVSPPLLLITTSSFLAIFRTSERRCLASEYEYTFMTTHSKIWIPISLATLFIPRSRVSKGLRRFSAHSKKYASYAYMLNFIAIFNASFMSVFLKSTGIC